MAQLSSSSSNSCNRPQRHRATYDGPTSLFICSWPCAVQRPVAQATARKRIDLHASGNCSNTPMPIQRSGIPHPPAPRLWLGPFHFTSCPQLRPTPAVTPPPILHWQPIELKVHQFLESRYTPESAPHSKNPCVTTAALQFELPTTAALGERAWQTRPGYARTADANQHYPCLRIRIAVPRSMFLPDLAM